MHEFSLARALLREVAAQAEGCKGASVRGVSISVGEFSGVEAELLRLAFDELREHTCAAGAELTINPVALTALCPACGVEFPVQGFRFVCPRCEQGEVRIIRGDELRLESLTIEGTEPEPCRPM
jgi:hydrogenase nickel incorporation protein HypA/HybF